MITKNASAEYLTQQVANSESLTKERSGYRGRGGRKGWPRAKLTQKDQKWEKVDICLVANVRSIRWWIAAAR